MKNGTTTTFAYGADGMRFKQTKVSGGQTWVTYYVGKGFEREIQPGNHILDKTFIGDHTTLNRVVSGTPEYAAKVVHTLNDRLGSPNVLISGATDTPTVIRQRAHGIFGRPIDAGTGSILDSLGDWDGQYRGYTGHEQLVEQQLIHMNGRVYDYNLGRFMSVDPFIQMPESSQSINPYSYIMNNPMAGTDPTGYIARGTNASNWRDNCFDAHGCLSTPVEQAKAKYLGSGQQNAFASLKAGRNNRMIGQQEQFAEQSLGNSEILDVFDSTEFTKEQLEVLELDREETLNKLNSVLTTVQAGEFSDEEINKLSKYGVDASSTKDLAKLQKRLEYSIVALSRAEFVTNSEETIRNVELNFGRGPTKLPKRKQERRIADLYDGDTDYAFVFPTDRSRKIFIDKAYFSQNRNARLITLAHEASHFSYVNDKGTRDKPPYLDIDNAHGFGMLIGDF